MSCGEQEGTKITHRTSSLMLSLASSPSFPRGQGFTACSGEYLCRAFSYAYVSQRTHLQRHSSTACDLGVRKRWKPPRAGTQSDEGFWSRMPRCSLSRSWGNTFFHSDSGCRHRALTQLRRYTRSTTKFDRNRSSCYGETMPRTAVGRPSSRMRTRSATSSSDCFG